MISNQHKVKFAVTVLLKLEWSIVPVTHVNELYYVNVFRKHKVKRSNVNQFDLIMILF